MSSVHQESSEWVDGFLFLGNKPILDFVNTRPVLAERPTELLPDFEALERWLVAAGIARSAKTRQLLREWRKAPEGASVHRDLLAFRERLRGAILQLEHHVVPSDEFIREVNVRLRQHPLLTELHRREGQILRQTLFDPQRPVDLWAPFLDGAASLLSEPETHRLRRCEACVVHFFDISKKGSRRWCSMNLCGNRFKVAAYQRRVRANSAG